MARPVTPLVAVDSVAFDAKGRVLLIRRKNPPFQGQYALPGGFDLSGREVDPGLLLRPQPGEEFAGAAADFEHGRVGRNQEIVIVGEQSPVAAGAGLGLHRRAVVERPDLVEVFKGEGGNGG